MISKQLRYYRFSEQAHRVDLPFVNVVVRVVLTFSRHSHAKHTFCEQLPRPNITWASRNSRAFLNLNNLSPAFY
jgi:hypothetical protein